MVYSLRNPERHLRGHVGPTPSPGPVVERPFAVRGGAQGALGHVERRRDESQKAAAHQFGLAPVLRVLQNLVTNAREALAKRPNSRITISAKRQHTQCVISVTDNGPGVPKDVRSSLFEPFVSYGKSGGTGLGLAIARSIVAAHHGSLEYTTSNAGTIFTIQLPMEQ